MNFLMYMKEPLGIIFKSSNHRTQSKSDEFSEVETGAGA